jgi:phosphoglycolate phosphatase
MTFQHIRAVAIDLDGTLLDTIDDLTGAANRTLTKLNLQTIAPAVLRTFVGKGKAAHVRKSLVASMGRDPSEDEMARAMVIYEREYFEHIDDNTRPYEGVREGLALFKQKKLPLACVTNKAKAFTVKLLERQGFLNDFALVLGGDELARSKPDPLMLQHTAQTFQVPTAQLLMIGDSANDALAARAAGCPMALMNYGYTEGQPLSSIPNDGIFSSFIEIAAALKS